MPRSWYQGARQLIADVRETFRLHFKQATVHALDVDIDVWDVFYDYEFYPESYGGVLFPQRAPNHGIPLYFPSTFSVRHPLGFGCRVAGEKTLFHRPELIQVPCDLNVGHQVHETPAISRTIPYHRVQGLEFAFPAMRSLPSGQWLLKRFVPVSQWAVERLKAPQTRSTQPMRSKAQLFPILKKSLPVQRKPIPPHRFSTAHRQQFRELLAQRAQLPVSDIQIVGVYDRIYLGLFQSLSQKEDGTLVCVPKSLAEPGLREKETVAVYLIVGKSFKMPGKAIQVVMPMSALQREEGQT